MVCFSLLKRKYSQRVRDLARQRVFHINKEGFLPAFKDAFFDVFTEENCRKAFQASGLVPINAQVVLDRLEVRLRTVRYEVDFGWKATELEIITLRRPPSPKRD